MSEVVCWCCDKYCVVYEHTTDIGLCLFCKRIISGNEKVCDEFIIRKGLHTKREIPAYCKNYNKKE